MRSLHIQLIIAPYTLYSFMIGSFLSVIWCVVAFSFTLRKRTPNLSLFPEIDVASKMVAEGSRVNRSDYSIAYLLPQLSNSGSIEIRQLLALKRFFVRYSRNAASGVQKSHPVAITLQENGLPLSRKRVTRI